MTIFNALFRTSIGKKVIMAVTGLILIGFIIGHLVGNLQIFSPPEKINAYAHFLQSLGPLLWVIRAFLLLTVVLHIWMAVLLVMENKAARPKDYKDQKTLRASYASRTMRYSGLIVLAFIIYHLLHFTVRVTHGDPYYPMTTIPGVDQLVPDVHSMMVLGFQEPLVAAFYLIAVALLSYHLSHGFSSMFQSLGLRSRAWSTFLHRFGIAFCVLYFLGNAAIVVAAYAGMVEVQNPNVEQLAAGLACPGPCDSCETVTLANN